MSQIANSKLTRPLTLSGLLLASMLVSACSMWGSSGSNELSSSEDAQIRPVRESFLSGQYDAVITQVDNTPSLTSGSVNLSTTALKYKAFSECLTQAKRSCASTFERILTLKPDFTLIPAEKSHPVWGPVFEEVKARHVGTPGATAQGGSISPIRPLNK